MSEAKRITPRPIREEQAQREVGHTEFAPGVRSALIAVFLGLILLGPIVQMLIPRPAFNELLGAPGSASDRSDPLDLTEARKVTATVTAVSSPPRRDAVYRDFVMRLHVTDLRDESGAVIEEESILGVMAMRNRMMLPVAGIRSGTTIQAAILPWDAVAARVDGINASALDGDRFLTMNQWWAASLIVPGADLLPGGMDFAGIWRGRGSELPAAARVSVFDGMCAAWGTGDGLLDALLAANGHLARRIKLYETALDDQAVPALFLRRPVQAFLASLGVGNEKAFVGRDGWLFFVPGVHAITGRGFLDPIQLRDRVRGGDVLAVPPQPDPRPAILALRDQLAERDIELVIMPTPGKPTIHPGQLAARLAGHPAPLRNRSYDACMDELDAAGVRIFDPAQLLKDRAERGPQYLATDTHWRPEAMQAVAAVLADVLQPLLPERSRSNWEIVETSHRQLGDIARMLDLSAWQTAVAPDAVTVQRVVDDAGKDWRPDPTADVLLLGDSFSNIYSLEGMGWGRAAGFAEHLSRALGRPLNRLCRNDAGAHTSRGMLAQALAQDPHFLEGKRVVVWQFAERELAVGDWKRIELPAVPAQPGILDPSLTDPVASAPGASAGPGGFAELLAGTEADDAVAYRGRDDWLFLVSEIRALANPPTPGPVPDDPGADPFSSIVDLNGKLQKLGIELILLPAPPRAAIYADKLLDDVPRNANGRLTRVDDGLQAFYHALEAEGVRVLDLADTFLAARAADEERGPVSCEQDTHWSPRGVRLAAVAVASVVKKMDWARELKPVGLHRKTPVKIDYVGDLVERVPGHAQTYSSAVLERVVASADSDEKVESDPASPIILLADSHGLVFSIGDEMHGEGAGLAEQIAYEIGIPLDVMARRGSGDSVRRDLARRFIRDPDLAATKKLVIYCFAARTFSASTGWKPVPLQR